RFADLQNFARAAALHFSGTQLDDHGAKVPAVRDWLAWNEPNNPIFLSPQYVKHGKTWISESAIDYAQICNAVYRGIHSTLYRNERVACGGTAPRGNNDPASSRPSVSPLAFLRAARNAGLRRFDAWAHNPYNGSPSDQPASRPAPVHGKPARAVELGNIDDLITLLTALYGWKP